MTLRTFIVRRLLNGMVALAALLAAAVVHYEFTSHSTALWGGPWPGWLEAVHADRVTPWVEWTGLRPVDRALHEGCEVAIYYRALLGGSVAWPSPAPLHVRQQS